MNNVTRTISGLLLACCASAHAQVTLLSEDFSTASGTTPPTGWSQNRIAGSSTDNWRFDNPAGRAISPPMSGQVAAFDSDNYATFVNENVALQSPAVDTTGYSQVRLRYDEYFAGIYNTGFDMVCTEVFNGTTWNSVRCDTTTAYPGRAASYDLDISIYAANRSGVRVRFRFVGNYSWWWLVDNVRIVAITAPGAPVIGAPTAGNQQISVAFTAPANNGGLPILDYTATCGGVSVTGATTPIVVGGLVNGTPYTCTVVARNAVGTSLPSAASAPATPVGAVASVSLASSANPSSFNAAVTFTATVTGASPTGTVNFKEAGSTLAGCGAVPLAAGTAQCVKVFTTVGTLAITADYSGDASNQPATGTLAGGQVVNAVAPGAPTIGTATAGNAQVSVAFTAPASNGGSAILDYTATCGARSATAAGSPIVVTGLANGSAVTCTVVARNAAGTGPASGPSNSATPSAAAASVSLASSANPSSFNSAVTFTATVTGASPTGTVNFKEAGSTLAGCGAVPLAAGTAQCVKVFTTVGTRAITADYGGDAFNQAATGTLAGGQVVNAVVPGAPTIGTATAGALQVSVAFVPPAFDGGSAILDYTATCGSVSATGTGSPIVVAGLTAGTPYTCTVRARNAAGQGPASAASNTATPTPGATVAFSGPTATGSGNATVSFTGGGATCTFAPQGTGTAQSAFFIPVSGHPKSPPMGTAPASFPHGLLDFVLLNCAPGATITFTVTYPTALGADTQYWKFGPRPGNPTPVWYVLPATIAGNTATFTITDGGLGDDDLAANGTLVDQGGPGSVIPNTPVQTPTLSEWSLLFLIVLIGAAGMRRSGRATRS